MYSEAREGASHQLSRSPTHPRRGCSLEKVAYNIPLDVVKN